MSKDNRSKDNSVRPVIFFLIGFLGFQIIWNLIILPLITR